MGTSTKTKVKASEEKAKKIKAEHETLYAPRDCKKCGEVFTPTEFHPNQKYCSNCGKAKKAKGDYSPRACQECGKDFTPTYQHPNQKYCQLCGKAKKNSSPLPDKIESTCVKCGDKFKISKFNPYVMICGKCKQKAKADKIKDKTDKIKPDDPDLDSDAIKKALMPKTKELVKV